MLQRKNESFDDYQKRMERRADILFPTMKDKNKSKVLKNLPLGKSIYDEDDDDDLPSIKNTGKIKSELEPLVEAVKEEKNSEQKSRKDKTPEEDEEILDLMYPSMKNTKNKKGDLKIPETSEKDDNIKETDKDMKKTYNSKKGNYTGGAADIEKSKIDNDENKSVLLKGSVSHEELKTNDTKFKNSMDVVFENEGGFSNRKNDKGGRTNLGITQKTYDDYCKRHNIETKDVKNLSKGEAVKVYYDDYWKASGADKIENPTEALILFDTAVLHGVGRAKQFYKQADGNFDKILQLRKDFYKKKVQEDSSQEEFLNGWNKRVDKLEKKLKQSRNN